MKLYLKKFLILIFISGIIFFISPEIGWSIANSPVSFPKINIEIGEIDEPHQISVAIQILALLTALSLAPGFFIMVTSFTRIVVVFSFLRHALSTQQMPPNQILIGLALFLTIFVMTPTWIETKKEALDPYLKGEITQEEAFKRGIEPIRSFMLKQTRKNDLALFIGLSGEKRPKTPQDIPTYILIPAFITSELKTAFQIGFIIYIPFLVIDIVVSSILMSVGMFMLPPMMISLPFKILLFVLVDGWDLMIRSLILSFK